MRTGLSPGRVPGVQGGDGVEQLAAVADRAHADGAEVLGGEPRQDLGVDVVVTERRLVALEA